MLFIKILFILGFVLLFSYIGYIVFKDKRIPFSISQTVNSLDSENKWLFTVIMFIVAMLIAPQLFVMMQPFDYDILAFMTALGLMGVGADPLDDDEKDVIHYVSAFIMGVTSQMIVWIVFPWMMTLWIPYVLYTMYMDDGRWNMMFAEMVMMVALLVSGLV
jgi:hypothetical protein